MIYFHSSTYLHLTPFVEEVFFYPLYDFGFLVNDQVPIDVWIYFWIFESIPLINMFGSVLTSCSLYHYFSLVQLEVRDGDSPEFSLIIENCFHYPGFSIIPYEVILSL